MYGHLHANKLPHVDNRAIRNRVVNSIYVIISLCLLLYSTTAIFFLNSTTHVEDLEPDHYDVENMTIVSDVDCTFKVSGQYELAPKYTCFVLLAFTVIIRNHGWLAAGAAASVLTYSGVAAIHLIVFFAVATDSTSLARNHGVRKSKYQIQAQYSRHVLAFLIPIGWEASRS